MRITRIETFILHVPVTRQGIQDSTHSISHWGAPGVIIHTDTGLKGVGYTGTHAHLALDRLIVDCIEGTYAPLLIGEDPCEVRYLWQRLMHFAPAQWVGRGGITHLALGAVDIALWDLKAKAAGQPLWKLLGGNDSKIVQAYNTDGGWLNWDEKTLVEDCRRLVEDEAFAAVKIKIGSPNVSRDIDRIAAVRNSIGPLNRLMVDVNGRWNLPTAIAFGPHLKEHDVFWIEEPIGYDDLSGHRRLAEAIDTPIALGEQLYLMDHFREFIQAGAVHYVQPDAMRLAGITEWWAVADLAWANRLPVVPHIGDMMQVHLHLTIAHPACELLEYIPWLRTCFEEPASVKSGRFVPPQLPGAGTTLRVDAIDRFGVK